MFAKKCLTLLCTDDDVALVQFVNFSYVHCCTNSMDNRPSVSAVRSLPGPQRLAHAAFTHCSVLFYHCASCSNYMMMMMMMMMMITFLLHKG